MTSAPPSPTPLRRLWSLVRVERSMLRRAAFFQTLQSLSYLPFHAGLSILIDRILQNADLTSRERLIGIGLYALANLALWPIHAFFTVRAFAAGQELVRLVTARLRRLVIDQLQHLSMSYFTRRGAGALANQVTNDLNRVEAFLANLGNGLVVGVALGIGSLLWLFFLQPILATIAATAIPLQIYIMRRVNNRLGSLNKDVQQSGENFSSKVVEFIGGMRVTKSLGNEEIAASSLVAAIERMRTSGLTASIAMRWVGMLNQMVSEYATVLVWCVGGILFLNQQMTLGALVAFTTMLGFVRIGTTSLFGAYDTWNQARPGLEAVLAILDSNELEGFSNPTRTVKLRGEIDLRHISFKYPGTEKSSLHEVHLKIPAGQRVGLVGETGAGKSTFLDLVLGFYAPTSGEILYDGMPLSELGLRQLRRQSATMGQDAFLWNTSIRENIRLGRADATDAEIEAAARAAQAHEFITALDNGYDTNSGERGSRLSGGQRQRLALARLFLRDPRIVVLDEPTSALDLETEARLQHDLDALCKNRTTFIVAHRLFTLRGVDRVLVFQKGRIVEDGSIERLSKIAGGHFSRLMSLQVEGLPVPAQSSTKS